MIWGVLKKRIVIVDDYSIGKNIARHLEPKGVGISIACSAKDFYKIFNSDVALAIINTELADQSGLALVKFLSSNVKIRVTVVS